MLMICVNLRPDTPTLRKKTLQIICVFIGPIKIIIYCIENTESVHSYRTWLLLTIDYLNTPTLLYHNLSILKLVPTMVKNTIKSQETDQIANSMYFISAN